MLGNYKVTFKPKPADNAAPERTTQHCDSLKVCRMNFLECGFHYIFGLYLASSVEQRHFSQTGMGHERMHVSVYSGNREFKHNVTKLFGSECYGIKRHLWDTEEPIAKAFILLAFSGPIKAF